MKRTLSIPLVVLIAVVALVLGSFGTATAASLTAKQVKKIAAKVVTKKAPGLSVLKAKTADSATTATTANSATTAATATNSTQLNGQPAATYLDRVAFASATNSVAVPAGFANSILGPVSITTPAGVNFVRLDGAATMSGGNFGLFWSADGATCSAAGPESDAAQFTVATTQGNASFHVVLPVTPGTHTYRLCSNNAAASVLARSLLIETVATGATGGSTLAKDGAITGGKAPSGTPGQAR